MEKKRVSRRVGLPAVSPYTEWPQDKLALRDAIKEELKNIAARNMPGVDVFFADPNTFMLGKQLGFSFGVSKFDEHFRKNLGAGEFRYLDKELFKTTAELIKKMPELSGNYRWDRGFGVFVINVFLK